MDKQDWDRAVEDDCAMLRKLVCYVAPAESMTESARLIRWTVARLLLDIQSMD